MQIAALPLTLTTIPDITENNKSKQVLKTIQQHVSVADWPCREAYDLK